MSEQEQDAIVGRLIREKSEALRRKAALDAELKMVGDTLNSIFERMHGAIPEVVAGQLEPIRKYFNTDSFLALLKEREEAQTQVIDRIKRLRDMGVSE